VSVWLVLGLGETEPHLQPIDDRSACGLPGAGYAFCRDGVYSFDLTSVNRARNIVKRDTKRMCLAFVRPCGVQGEFRRTPRFNARRILSRECSIWTMRAFRIVKIYEGARCIKRRHFPYPISTLNTVVPCYPSHCRLCFSLRWSPLLSLSVLKMHFKLTTVALATLVAQVYSHGLVTSIQGSNGVVMPGLGTIDGTPRDCST
jgi:hypothetical protein